MAHSSILQWNCRGLRVQYEEICILMSKYSPSIVCLQEILLKGKGKDSSIYTHRSVSHSTVPYDGPLSDSALKVSLDKEFTICSLYLRPALPLKQHDLDNLYRQLPSP